MKYSAVYVNAVAKSQLPKLYYSISWKDYSKDKSTWKPTSAIMYRLKMIGMFHKNYLKKSTTMFLPVDCPSTIAKLTIQPATKRKRGRLAKDSIKQAKKYKLLNYIPNLNAMNP